MTLAAGEEPRRSHCGSHTCRDTVQRQNKVPPPYGKAVALVSCCNHVASCRHLDDVTHTHTHTHTHTSSSSCHHVLKDVGRDPGYCRRGRLGWRIAARHPEQSMINSCQSVTPERSLLTTSHHRSGVPPSGLLLPLGRHFNTCF